MVSLIYSDLSLLRKHNFGFGKANQLNGMRRLGFCFNFFGSSIKKFRFIKPKKIESIFLTRVVRLVKSNLLVPGSCFNLNLQRKILRTIDFLKFNRSWRGVRHINNLPVRGQRTKTNARTRKSRRSRK